MAEPKKNSLFSVSFSGNFLTQLLFGLFLSLVFGMTLGNASLSIFLGVLGGVALGWFTTATTTNPQSQAVASSEGIDAGLKYWLFFLLGFALLGYQPSMSIFLSGIAGVAGGWTIAWWKSREESRTQLPDKLSEDMEAEINETGSTRRRAKRRTTRRYRRAPGFPSFRFWKK
ncbi:MAG: hypothetical protein DSM106950_15960 [Stigonema ocellatum SAG 48.90 = DSM 106950]|nr:hypothetical protein [Stigonema ocellatum SAG 48.90 = DSM 106950]